MFAFVFSVLLSRCTVLGMRLLASDPSSKPFHPQNHGYANIDPNPGSRKPILRAIGGLRSEFPPESDTIRRNRNV